MSILELIQTGAPLRSSGLIEYYRASFGGESSMIRRFRCPDFWNPLRRVSATADFIQSMQLQQTLGRQSDRWQKVFAIEASSMDDAACAAADVELNLGHLILLQSTLDPENLVRLVREVLEALRDALAHTGRAHGNLSADRILLASRNLSECRIALCEPIPRASAEVTIPADLQALGRIICEILTGRFWSPTTPLELESADYKKCGSNYRQWMAFTRDLLQLDHNRDSLDQFLARVDALRPRKSRAPAAAAVIAVLLIAAAVGFVYLRHRQEMARLARFNGAWPVYVKNYSTWFGPFAKDRPLLESSPEFASIRKELAKRPVLNPDSILHEFTALLSMEKIQHDLASSAGASRRFGRAVILLMRSEHALAKIYTQLAAAQTQWQNNGWNLPARQLKTQLLANLTPDTALMPFLKLHSAPWAKSGDIRRFTAHSAHEAQLQLRNLLAARRVEADYHTLEQSFSVLAKTPHRLVSGFPAYATNYLKRCRSIHALGRSVMVLARQARLAERSIRKYASRLQWKLINARRASNTAVSPEQYFPNWFDYCSIRPNRNSYLAERAAIKARIASIQLNISRAQRLPRPPTVNYSDELHQITAPLAAISNPDFWIEKNKNRLDSVVQSTAAHLTSLHAEIVAFIDSEINLKKWTAQFIGYDGSGRHYPVNPLALDPFSLRALNQLYRRRIEFIILGPGASAAAPWKPDAKTYHTLLASLRSRRWQVPEINTRVAALKTSIRHLADDVFKLRPVPHKSPPSRANDARLLAATLIPARMAAIEVACRLGTFGPHETFIPPKRVLDLWQKQQTAYDTLLDTIRRLDERLVAAPLYDESSSKPSSIALQYALLTKNLWWSNPTVVSVTAPLRRSIKMAIDIQKASVADLPSLASRIPAYPWRWQPFLVRSLWHRAGHWRLKSHADLLTLEQNLAQRLDAFSRGPAFKKSHPRIAARLREHLRLRWERRLNQADAVGRVVPVVLASPSYGVTLNPIRTLTDLTAFHQLSSTARFNLLVFTLNQQASGIKSPARAKQIAGHFVGLLDAALKHPAYRVWKTLPPYPRLTAELQAVLKANPAKSSEPSGPALAGWHEQKISPTQRLFTAPGGRQHLRFTLVHPATGHACFVCDQELRVGIFLHTVHSSDNILRRPASDFFNLIKYNANYLGPHTWVYSRRTDDISVAPTWFTNTNQIYAAPRFPASIAATAGKLRASAGGNPTRDDPVQYLPPRAAVYLAALLGCRLPTPQDWQAAYRQSRAPSAGALLPGRALASYVAYLRREDSTIDARLPTPRFWDIFGSSAPALRAYRNDYGNGRSNRLFFQPITNSTASPPFANLVGNVAEYVFNDTGAYSRALKQWYKNRRTLTAASVQSLLTARAMKHFYVIGGSALTPLGKISPDTPITINWATRRAKGGFSDVGIRLAYRRRVLTPQQLLARLIRRNHYADAG
ncbi:MAG: hypothetical protein ACP5O1_01440 [Phycisphaerae bacterium]